MWLLYIFLFLIFSAIFTLFYKVATKDAKDDGTLTVLIQIIAVLSAVVISLFFKIEFPKDTKTYVFLAIACIFYAIADRLNTTARRKLDASSFSIIHQLVPVIMIIAGLIFFKEKIIFKKMLGALLIIFSNIFIFYEKGKQKIDKGLLTAILANLSLATALFIDVNISKSFNIGIYIVITLLVPSLLISAFEKIKIANIKKEFNKGNKKAIVITGVSWSLLILSQLKAYQLGEVTTVAPLAAIHVVINIFAAHFFLKEKGNLFKKGIAAILIIISIILINS